MKRVPLFPLIVSGYAIYYVFDVFGGKFETVGYGFLCVALVLLFAGLNLVQTAMSDASGTLRQLVTWRGPYAFAVLALYAYGQVTVGFTLATFLAATGLLWWLGTRQIGKLLITSGAMTLIAYIILIEILNVPMPEGLWGLRSRL